MIHPDSERFAQNLSFEWGGVVERHWIRRQLNLRTVRTELRNGPVMAGLAGHRKFKVVHPRQASTAARIFDKTDFLQRHVAIQQLDLELGAMLLDPLQRPLAQAVVVPYPGGARRQQHQHEHVSQGQHVKNSNKVSAA